MGHGVSIVQLDATTPACDTPVVHQPGCNDDTIGKLQLKHKLEYWYWISHSLSEYW
jgi:hypothetical protein